MTSTPPAAKTPKATPPEPEKSSSRKGWPRRVKTPTLLQLEAVECGAATLGMMLAHHGRIVPLATLRQDCGVSRDGSKASNMVKAARRYGMKAGGFKKSLESLRELPPPYIVFWHFNHFVVVEGFTKDKVWLNDPASGHRTVSFEEFDEGFTGVVLTMEPGDEFEKGGKKPSVIDGLKTRLHGAWTPIFFCILAGFLLAIPGLVIPALSKVYIDEVVIKSNEGWLRPLLLTLGVAAVAQAVLRFLQLRYLREFQMTLSARLSAGFMKHLFRLPTAFYQQRFAGEIAGRTQLNDSVAGVLGGQLATTVIDGSMMIFYAALMLSYDVTLTLVAIVAAAANLIALRLISKYRVEANMKVGVEFGKLYGVAVSGLQRMETIKSSGQENGFFSRWAGLYTNASNARQQMEVSNQLLNALPSFLQALVTMTVLGLGGWRVIEGALSIGSIVAFQSLLGSFMGPVSTLMSLGTSLQNLQSDLNRLDDVLAQEPKRSASPESEEDPDDDDLERARLRGEVEIRGLTFGYSRLDPPLIEGFDLRIRPGERVALVGGSGSGKTTVARLLTGQYEPWEGAILFDGSIREEVPRHLLCNSLALVDQDVTLYGGSTRDNLTLWDETIPDDNLERACRDAEILDVVQALPGSFDGILSEGAENLSGGQRQRLEIARSLVNDPTILVLDEATSALDAEVEYRISERLRMRGCTCVLVAHRLSTIRDCDEILVMEKGKVVERGTHDELWKLGGAYARLLQADETSGAETS